MLKHIVLLLCILLSSFCQADFSYLMHKNSLIKKQSIFYYDNTVIPTSLIPETVKLNMELCAKNPLHNESIACFSVFEDNLSILDGSLLRPIVVIDSCPNTIYMINKSGEEKEVISAVNFATGTFQGNVPDSQGKIASKIISVEASCPYVFALTRPSHGIFGEKGTGVAHMVVGKAPVLSNGKKQYFTGLMILDSLSGQVTKVGGNRAASLDIASDFLKVGGDLKLISSGNLFWHKGINRLYVSLKVEGGSDSNDGGRAISVGRIDRETHSLSFDAIVPISVFANDIDAVIGGIGPSLKISIEKIKEFKAESGLDYLVGIGGIGKSEKANKKMFCLPLVSGNSDEALNGTIASKHAIPKLNPEKGKLELDTPAYHVEEMPEYFDSDVTVGNGHLAYPALDFFVQNNVVIAVTKNQNEAIVFVSKPYFDKNGKIAHWSKWAEMHRFKIC